MLRSLVGSEMCIRDRCCNFKSSSVCCDKSRLQICAVPLVFPNHNSRPSWICWTAIDETVRLLSAQHDATGLALVASHRCRVWSLDPDATSNLESVDNSAQLFTDCECPWY
eukprot:TRINITY_DN1082_c0_g1_i5.p2 TRINITY_DN1082_c0_g1~~TRINITY_DN1082_c0_g1_i5.p2  ORF type:complete len:111 (-),score=9.23 TRINITY_DN1082_c0_g1_i5:1105-1437(-)